MRRLACALLAALVLAAFLRRRHPIEARYPLADRDREDGIAADEYPWLVLARGAA